MKRSCAVLAVVIVVASLFAAACVQQKRFRFVPARTACFPETDKVDEVAGPSDQWPSLDCHRTQYKLAFIEFDENGRLYEKAQEDDARRLLESEKKRAKSDKIITVIYIHGWKNNASQAQPGGKPKDVEKFQGALLELGHRAEEAARPAVEEAGRAAAAEAARAGADAAAQFDAMEKASAAKKAELEIPIVGIYMAWRGKTLMGPGWFTFASLWSRRNTANNIGDGPDLGPILDNYINITNRGSGRSRVLLIGHSFGARVLEHAIESNDIRLDAPPGADGIVRPRVELVLYVNSANDSRLSMRRVQQLRDANLTVRHPDFDADRCNGKTKWEDNPTPETIANRCRREYPLVVAISSTGDSPTRRLLPAANTINGDSLTPVLAKKMPDPPTQDIFLDPLPSTGKIRKTAAAHFGFLQSHVAREVRCPALRLPAEGAESKSIEAMIDDAVRRAMAAAGKVEPETERQKREAAEGARRLAEQQRIDRALHPVCALNDQKCHFVFRTLGDKPTCYQVDKRQADGKREPFNETPFWIMNVAPPVIKDHGDVWNVSFIEMLGQLMAPRGFFEPGKGRMQIRAK